MTKMKTQNYKKYDNEYTPSWVKQSEEEKEKEKKYFDDLVGVKKKYKSINKKQNKPIKHKGKKSAKKFYAIKNGRKKNLIVNTWSECAKLVIGYPNAKFKGFDTKLEAEKFLE